MICFQMHKTHLLLASQTQFFESGVKEAKNVSSTDRSEELRTALTIIRSATPLGKSKLDEDTSYNSSKVTQHPSFYRHTCDLCLVSIGPEIRSTMHVMQGLLQSSTTLLLKVITKRNASMPRRQEWTRTDGTQQMQEAKCHLSKACATPSNSGGDRIDSLWKALHQRGWAHGWSPNAALSSWCCCRGCSQEDGSKKRHA